jgi:hypothetical protein
MSRVAWIVVLSVLTSCADPPELAMWTQIVRERPRHPASVQVYQCRRPPPGARATDLARCHDVLAPFYIQDARADLLSDSIPVRATACMASLDALFSALPTASWWPDAGRFTHAHCCVGRIGVIQPDCDDLARLLPK